MGFTGCCRLACTPGSAHRLEETVEALPTHPPEADFLPLSPTPVGSVKELMNAAVVESAVRRGLSLAPG